MPFGSYASPTGETRRQVPAYLSDPGRARNPYDYSDVERTRAATLYGYENPQGAFDNVLRDWGYNPYAANPFVQTIRRQARPLQQAFLTEAATAGDPEASRYAGGARSMELAQDPYGYARWLAGAQDNGVYASLQQAQRNVPHLVRSIQQHQEALNRGVPLTDINPFTQLMMETLAENNGQGTIDYMKQLYAPTISATLREPYGQALDAIGQSALRNMMYGGNYQGDIWDYLFRAR